jgi:hypothetical protein
VSGVKAIVNGVISVKMRIPALPPTEIPPPPPDLVPPDMRYQYWQEVAVNEMTIDHHMGFMPAAVTLISADGMTRYESFGTSYVNENRVIVTTELRFRGWVLLS